MIHQRKNSITKLPLRILMRVKVPQTTAENTITPIQILFQQPQKLINVLLKNCYTCNSIQMIYYKINPLHSFFFVSFWIALQKTWYYQKIVKGTRIKLRAHLSNKALIKFHSVLWYLKFVHATFQVCLYGLSVSKIEILSKLNKIQMVFSILLNANCRFEFELQYVTLIWIKSCFLSS